MDDTSSLSDFLQAWEIFRDAVLASTLAGGLLGFLGVYVVLRRMVFFSAALAQAAGFGVTVAFYAQIYWGLNTLWGSPAVGAAVFTVASTYVVMRHRDTHTDALLGMIYLVGAAGALSVATRIVQELQDIQTILFGSAVAVLPQEFNLIAILTAGLLLLHGLGARGFIQASFDPEGAKIRGLPVKLLDAVLLGSLALAISLCTRVLGALPVFAFSTLPALAALMVAANVKNALALAFGIGAMSGCGGYVLAYCYKLPVGAAQALLAAGWVLLLGGVRRSLQR